MFLMWLKNLICSYVPYVVKKNCMVKLIVYALFKSPTCPVLTFKYAV
jgi:hypothetical protein